MILKGAVGHVELVALVFHLFDGGNDGLAVVPVGAQVYAHLPGLVLHVALAGQVGHEHPALVADQLSDPCARRPGILS
jgi:hypothetical protein